MAEYADSAENLSAVLARAVAARERLVSLLEQAGKPVAEQPNDLALQLRAYNDEYLQHLDTLLDANRDCALESLPVPESMKPDIRDRWIERDRGERFARAEEYERNAKLRAGAGREELVDNPIPGRKEQREHEQHQRYLEMKNRQGPDDHPDPEDAKRYVYER